MATTGAMPVVAFRCKAWLLAASLFMALSPLGVCKTLGKTDPSDDAAEPPTPLARSTHHKGHNGLRHKTPHHAHLAPAGGKASVLAQTGSAKEASTAATAVDDGKPFHGVEQHANSLTAKVEEFSAAVDAAGKIKEQELKQQSKYGVDVAKTHTELKAAGVHEIDLRAQGLLQVIRAEPGRTAELQKEVTHKGLNDPNDAEPVMKQLKEKVEAVTEAQEGGVKDMPAMLTQVIDIATNAADSEAKFKGTNGEGEHEDMKKAFEQAKESLTTEREKMDNQNQNGQNAATDAQEKQKAELDNAQQALNAKIEGDAIQTFMTRDWAEGEKEELEKTYEAPPPVKTEAREQAQTQGLLQMGETVVKAAPVQPSNLQLGETVVKAAPVQPSNLQLGVTVVKEQPPNHASNLQLTATVVKDQPPHHASNLQLTASEVKAPPSQQPPPAAVASILQVGDQASTPLQPVPSAPLASVAQLGDQAEASTALQPVPPAPLGSLAQLGDQAEASTALQLVPPAPLGSVAQLGAQAEALLPAENTVYLQAGRLRGFLDRDRQGKDWISSPATPRTLSLESTPAHVPVSETPLAMLQKSA